MENTISHFPSLQLRQPAIHLYTALIGKVYKSYISFA